MKIRVLTYLAAALTLSSCSSVKDVSPNQGIDSIPAAKIVPAAPAKTSPSFKKPVPAAPIKSTVSNISPVIPRVEPPVRPAKPQMPGARISRVSVPDKIVALTFDDGPHGALTPRVLDILNRYDSKGTFFVLGSNVSRHPALLQRMVSGGHEVGNHTWNHMNMSKASREAISADLAKTNASIFSACGVTPKVMRPPYGAGNSALSSWMKENFGATTVLWDVDTNDWRKPGVQTVINRAVNGARPGSIILVHDIHKSTVDAVEGIVRGLKDRGFQLVTVSELMRRGRDYARSSSPEITPPSAQPIQADQAAPVTTDSRVEESISLL